MLSYYISQSNEFVIRTQDTASVITDGTGSGEQLTLILEDMLTYSQSYYPLPTSSYSWNPYEPWVLSQAHNKKSKVIIRSQLFVTGFFLTDK